MSERIIQGLMQDIRWLLTDIKVLKESTKRLEERLNIISLEVDNFKSLIEDLADVSQYKIKVPHRCPLCNGLRFDDKGMLCHACDGKGLVWG